MKSSFVAMAGTVILTMLAAGCSDSSTESPPEYTLGPGETMQFVAIDQTVQGPSLSLYALSGRVGYAVQREVQLPKKNPVGASNFTVTLRADLQIRRLECDEGCQRLMRTSVDAVIVEPGQTALIEKTFVFGPANAPRFLRLRFRVAGGEVTLAGVAVT